MLLQVATLGEVEPAYVAHVGPAPVVLAEVVVDIAALLELSVATIEKANEVELELLGVADENLLYSEPFSRDLLQIFRHFVRWEFV